MYTIVFPLGAEYIEVIRVVVKLVTINMVDDFLRPQFSTQFLFGGPAVHGDVRILESCISIVINVSFAAHFNPLSFRRTARFEGSLKLAKKSAGNAG